MTIVEYYLNLINEASINLQKAQKLITDTVCTECKKSRFKRGCTACAQPACPASSGTGKNLCCPAEEVS